MVRRVEKGGPADKAGVQPFERFVTTAFGNGYIRDPEKADIIVSVAGSQVNTLEQFSELVRRLPRNESVPVTLKQGGLQPRERTITITPVLQ